MMQLGKNFISVTVFLLLVFSYASLQASQKSDAYFPLSSLMVEVDIDMSVVSSRLESTVISLFFSLDADSDGIFPADEDVTIGLSPINVTGNRKQYFLIYIPAYSFERIKNWYAIDDRKNPTEIGIKVLIVDESTGGFNKDITDNLTFFYSIITPTKEDNQYYLIINASFENEYMDLMSSISFIGSSPTSVLLVGNDSGSNVTHRVEF